MTGSEHVIFLWENEETKNQIISDFFNQQVNDSSSSSAGLFSIEPVRIPNVENTLYESFHNLHKTAFLNNKSQKEYRQILEVAVRNMPSKTIRG